MPHRSDPQDDLAQEIPEHIGTATEHPSPGATKSKHLQEAEKIMLSPKCSAMTKKVGGMPFRQEATLREGEIARIFVSIDLDKPH